MRDDFYSLFTAEKFFNNWLGQLRPSYDWFLRSLVIDRMITERPAEWLPKEYKDYDAMVIDSYRAAGVQ